MSFAKPQDEANGQMESALVESMWQEIRERLEHKRRQIFDEIKNYPPPIAACDQQFNHLLEQREGIDRALSRMREASGESRSRGDTIRSLVAFMESSDFLDDETKQKMTSALKKELSERHI